MTSIEYTVVNFPTYALSGLINADITGMDEKDVDAMDAWEAKIVSACFNEGWKTAEYVAEGESYFSTTPAFGLPCDCVELTVIFLK